MKVIFKADPFVVAVLFVFTGLDIGPLMSVDLFVYYAEPKEDII